MKKIVLLCSLFLSMFVCERAYAQLNITAAVEKEPERLLVGQMSYSYLYKTGLGNYEFWAKTDNQFDKNYTSLFLGNTPQSAIQTLNDLKSLMEKEVAAVQVQQEDGDVILTFKKQLGVRMLWIKQEGQAGKSWISLPIVEKTIKYFEEQIQAEQILEKVEE